MSDEPRYPVFSDAVLVNFLRRHNVKKLIEAIGPIKGKYCKQDDAKKIKLHIRFAEQEVDKYDGKVMGYVFISSLRRTVTAKVVSAITDLLHKLEAEEAAQQAAMSQKRAEEALRRLEEEAKQTLKTHR
jgi:hypothetical protein